MLSFNEIYQLAVQKQGSAEAVESRLPTYLSDSALRQKSDDRYLSDICLRVFMAGLSRRMVMNKWDEFEKRFFGFNPKRCAFMNADEMEQRMSDAMLIRHLPKMKAIIDNAFMVDEIATKHGSFGNWLADWPQDDTVGLWLYLRKHGGRLGGNSAPIALRICGKDTFLLTDDVIDCLVHQHVIDKKPTAKKDLFALQERMNQWQSESQRPLCEISRIISLAA
ncbi:DNA-3-methyladenine glycosylase 1 [BD1-7 clade bacterium]|uniref:DNA-3-methyladenine glycosylase 1 n=1 Tax=BD1-7 clade bacterium TaxID=2029982 RepID=A0A5S9MW97_9GAMM|nr:DNA-3-methyladenine glycosylase 1 [BD1-7 clade bacterium]